MPKSNMPKSTIAKPALSAAAAPSAVAFPSATVTAIYRHPVKGLSAEPMEQVRLEAGAFFPGDRLYAVENGPSGFDPAAPAYRQKTSFLMLMRDARLAALRSCYEDETSLLTLTLDGVEVVQGDLSTPEGRAEIAAFLTFYMGEEARGPLHVLTAPDGFRFTDSLRSGFISLLNLASVRDLSQHMGADVDPLRFRMNLHLDGWDAGSELTLSGREIEIGGARLAILKRTERCAAVNVNPADASRDLNVVKALARAYGHADCGVYAKVVRAGDVRRGDRVTLLS
ncbi:MOSC domain-containing protein [Xanthobacter agilis]|uniref:MOSC domain-containing protein n=1 Tax=Xanthobacter agilis TaxID=47492 RepID=UPI0037292787